MPKIYTAPDTFLEYKDITIYNTYKNGDYDNGPLEYLFTADINEDEENEFDIRALSTYEQNKDYENIIKEAIDRKEIFVP